MDAAGTIAVIGGGFAGTMLVRALDEKLPAGYELLPTLGRKVRIFVEWTWAMLFRTDITHFRFQRSADVVDMSMECTAKCAPRAAAE